MSPTTITPGQRLGPYEIDSRLGAGGMGEVWKARDTRLDRSVAIKILSAEFSQDAQLKSRFEREAKTISQLNHPHICTLYDVGDDYLVMELIEGESLADRLSRGALPLPDVLKYGAQTADALDRAHCAGVVHRDLKPGNVMITRAGAKLLDFGLAKTAAFDEIGDGATVQKPLTQEGMIPRHLSIHGAGTARDRQRRRAVGHLRAGRGAVRDGHRPPRVRREIEGLADRGHRQRAAAADVRGVALSGGQPIELAHAAIPRGAEWLADDTIVFCPYFYGGIERVPASGGAATPISKVDRAAGERSHRWPHALPGGKVVLYSIGLGSSWDNAKVVAQRLDTGERKVVLSGGCDARYVPTGHLVYVRGTSVYAIPFDAEALEVRGQPVEVLTGVANHSAGGAEFVFSRNGMLVYFSPGVRGDEGGTAHHREPPGRAATGLAAGRRVLESQFFPGRLHHRRRARLEHLGARHDSRDESPRGVGWKRVAWPVWSSDGSRVYYSSERPGWWQIFTRAADGSDEERQIAKTDAAAVPLAMSPDGRELLVRSDRKETAGDVDIMDLDGRIRPFARSEADELPGAFSPDGRWIAYSSDESGRPEIFVRPATGAAGRWQISTEGGIDPRWALPDEIAYLQGSRIMAVTVKTTPASQQALRSSSSIATRPTSTSPAADESSSPKPPTPRYPGG